MRRKKEATPPPRQCLASLIDALREKLGIKTDREFAAVAGLAPPEVSKARHGTATITPYLILKLHEAFDIPVKEIRSHIKEMPA